MCVTMTNAKREYLKYKQHNNNNIKKKFLKFNVANILLTFINKSLK